MKNLSFGLFIIIFVLFSCSKKGISTLTEVENETIVSSEKQVDEPLPDFPSDWIGVYNGKLKIYNAKGLARTTDMKLTIEDKDSLGLYPWKMQYGDSDIRNYALKEKDADKGWYVMDEFNGLFLDGFFLGNTYISHFSVESVEITSIYKKIGKDIQFQIVSSGTDTLQSNITIEEEEEFKASSFPAYIYQNAMLKKEKTLSK